MLTNCAPVLFFFFTPFAAVKFGRMSKKQREKVEDEVRFHRAQMRAQSDAAPDSSVYDTQTPSSSDQLQHNNYNRCSIEKYYAILHSSLRYTYSLVYPSFSLALFLSLFFLLSFLSAPSLSHSYSGGYSNNEVGYGSPYGYSASVTPQQTMQYDISADYVDSTTYEPRSTMIDPEFISHGKWVI